jgi:hypothetical protein
MFTKTRTMIIGLALVGVVVVAGAVYGATAWAAGPPASTATSQATQTVSEAQRAAILDMIKDHMGLTGAEAEILADQMIARCGGLSGNDSTGNGGWGMMDGSGGCLNGANGANGSTPRGMMGNQGGMMGSWN